MPRHRGARASRPVTLKADRPRKRLFHVGGMATPDQWRGRVGGRKPCRFLDPVREPARFRHSLYRTLRRFAGPALAYRLAFAGRAEA